MKQKWPLFAAIPMVASIMWSGAVHGQDAVVRLPTPSHLFSDSEVRNAKPLENSLAAPDTSRVRALPLPGGVAAGASESSSGSEPRAFGNFGIPYTETRVQLGPTNQTSASAGFALLASTFPYRAIGKLIFTSEGDEYHCTASVIRRGIIVTAAHCVQDFGSGNALFTNFQFIPANDGRQGATAVQQRPYGLWTVRSVVRPDSWADGTDAGCDAARNNDLAVLALNKSQGKHIGEVVGQLAYGWNSVQFISSPKTGNRATAAVSTLGYPGLLDGGLILQRTDGPSYLVKVPCPDPQDNGDALNIWQGSNFTPGSSGGPWIVNFSSLSPVFSGGANAGKQSTPRTVIGVTSWGSEGPNAIKDNYSSRFGQNAEYPLAKYDNPSRGAGNIAALLTTLCNSAAGGGLAGSYEANGWCN